jgi:hypothetical protein
MNERITELMLEAGKTIPGDKHIDADFCEKFAELIVQECIDCVRGAVLTDEVAVKNNLGFNDGLSAAVVNVQKHFGVEE